MPLAAHHGPTRQGTFTVELYWQHAPLTCRNFAELVSTRVEVASGCSSVASGRSMARAASGRSSVASGRREGAERRRGLPVGHEAEAEVRVVSSRWQRGQVPVGALMISC